MNNTKLYCVTSFLSGLLLGWLAIGWWLWPVAYVGEANTYELNQDDKLRYASAVVDSYAATGIADPAWFSGWYADEIQQAMEQVAQTSPAKANWARALANQASAVQPVQVKAQDQIEFRDGIPDWLLWPAILVALLGFSAGGWLIWHNRTVSAERGPVRGFETAFVSRTTEEYIPVKATPTSKLALMSTHLTFGPNHPTDQHLPIERDGIAMGEFGVSQVEDWQAWDVWLFDPKALGTVTKVLSDERGTALDGRGEFIAWKEPFTLETHNLKMTGIAIKQLEGGLQVELTVEGKDAE